jgi:hypothetical protein
MNQNEMMLLSYVKEIEAKYNRLGRITHHNLTEGVYREKLIIEILKNYLSPAIGIKTGFIKSITDDQVSRQLDIMLIDNNKPFSAYYQDNDFSISRSNVVLDVIEVKSKMTKKSIREVRNNLMSVKDINNKIRYSAFFYSTASHKKETIVEWLKEELMLPTDIRYWPNRISILNHGSFILYLEEKKISLVYGKPKSKSMDDIKIQVLCDFIANTIKACNKEDREDKNNPFIELGFGEWETIGKLVIGDV